MMRRTASPSLLAFASLPATLAATLVGTIWTGQASASALEFPENGTELMGRAGAWVARADNPLAAAYNPAGLAGQQTAFLLNSNFTYEKFCFARAGTYSPDVQIADTIFGRTGDTFAGEKYPKVCKENGIGNVNVVPQLAFAYRINEKFAISFAVVSPASAGKAKWPETVTTENGKLAPSPQRYSLIEKSGIILSPTLAAGYEVTKGLRLGAAFQATFASFDFGTMSRAANGSKEDYLEGPFSEMRTNLKATKAFTPGFILGALITPMDNFDIGAMVRYAPPITATSGDIFIRGPYFGDGRRGSTTVSETKGTLGSFKLPQPLDVRLGFRYSAPRKGATPLPGRPDFLKDMMWDVEVDFTFAMNSQIETIDISIPGGQPVNFADGKNTGTIPVNPSQRREFKDSFGIRLGGEYVAIPDMLGIRAGAYMESAAANPKYQGVDFLPTRRIGLYIGATFRAAKFIDISLGFGKIFAQDIDTSEEGIARGLAAKDRPTSETCDGTLQPTGATPADLPNNRTCSVVNRGVFSGGYTMFSLGATAKF